MKPTLQGIAASDGIAIAKVYTLTEPDLTVTKVTVVKRSNRYVYFYFCRNGR